MVNQYNKSLSGFMMLSEHQTRTLFNGFYNKSMNIDLILRIMSIQLLRLF